MKRTVAILVLLLTGGPLLISQIDQDGQILNANGESVECNNQDVTQIEADIENLLINYIFSDSDGDICADMTPVYVPGSVVIIDSSPYTCGDLVEVSYEIECDGGATMVSGIVSEISVEDLIPPVITLINGIPPDGDPVVDIYNLVDCDAIPATPWVVEAEDDCEGTLMFNPVNVTMGDCFTNEVWEYDITDACGNSSTFMIEWEVDSSTPLTALEDYSGCTPGVILTEGDCALMGGIFCNPNAAVWQENMNDGSGCVIPPFPFPGISFEGGCEPYEYSVIPAYAPVPTSVTLPDGSTIELDCPPLPFAGPVVWTVGDACGATLEFTFDLELQCVGCPPVLSNPEPCIGIFIEPCSHCESAIADPGTPCYSCDATVLDGFCSCTISGSSEIDTTQFSRPLCDDIFFPNNMSWFSFNAGSPELDVNITNVDCLGGSIGIQTGIYAECEIGECLASDNNCGTNDDKSFSLVDLTVGNTYYIYVDGCAGAACNYSINLGGVAPFEFDEPLAITGTTASQGQLGDPCDPDNAVTTCVGESVVVMAHHDGSSFSDFGIYDDECSIYDPEIEAEFIWSFTPAINGMTFESFITPDELVPPLTPLVGTYEICLELVSQECDDTEERACMELIVTDCAPIDNDGDGFAADQDCNDNDPNNFPGNMEVCDNQDNNCDGLIDEGITQATAAILSCAMLGPDFVTVIWNQNPIAQIYNVFVDGNLFTSTTNNSITISGLDPGQTVELRIEVEFNNGCAPLSSNLSCTTSAEQDIDGDGSPAGVDCDDNDPENYPGNQELCDGQDNNCNGQVDEGFPDHIAPIIECTADTATMIVRWNQNSTAQIYNVYVNGNLFVSTQDNSVTITGLQPGSNIDIRVDAVFNNGCSSLSSSLNCSTVSVIDNDGDGSPAGVDCDDNDPDNYPGNTELCDGQDNNCNGQVDEGFAQSIAPTLICADTGTDFITVSWDTISTAQVYNVFLNGGFFTSTTENTITISGLNANATNVIRVEVIFSNGCNAMESVISCATGMVGDADGDGSPDNEDCDDNDPGNYPGNTELCDGQDNNCNNEIDEGLSFQDYYVDADGDGYGSNDEIINACAVPMGFAATADDCDDSDPLINPGVDEIPNNTVDENCDGEVLIIDNDGDGWNSDLDCDDTNAAINPGATEVPGNGIDEDCDGEDGPSATYEIDGMTIEIFPNPVVEKLNIVTDLPLLSYMIISVDGVEVLSGQAERQIDFSELEQGCYFLRIAVEGSEKSIVERILKL